MSYTQPVNGNRESNAASYYQGVPLVENSILASQRIYDRRTAMLAYVEQGRAALARLVLNYARVKGAYVATDVETRWGIEYKRLPRIYFNASSGSSASNKNDILKVSTNDGGRIQVDDIFALQGMYVPPDRNVGDLTNDVPATTKSADSTTAATFAPLPEMVRVTNKVATTTGYDIYVERNFGGTGLAAAGNASMQVTTATTFYLWKAGNSLEENSDDQEIYSDTNDWDYNFCQYVMRKWGAGELEENINRFFENPGESTFARNGRRALNEFFDELDVIALLGRRQKKVTANNKYKGYAGGLLDFVPDANYHQVDDSFFQTKNFNWEMRNKFFFGAQTKIALCGSDAYTKVSNMLDNKIILPAERNSWGLELIRFNVTNGGTLLMAASDTMSLNGMESYMILYDPDTFQYGHLQNMDIKQITPPVLNPHERTGEVYGMITFKRTNPDANHVFIVS